MYGLPDSAVLGTLKRFGGRRGRRHRTEIEAEDFLILIYAVKYLSDAVKRFGARRRKQSQRAAFYKKHGFYKQ